MRLRGTLDRAAEVIFDEASSPARLLEALTELHLALSELAPLDDDPLAAVETELDAGLAIAPTGAARCLLDPPRTAALCRGLRAAIEAQPGRSPTRVVYAGCGPWATLALPVIAALGPAAVEFTLIDVHPASIERAERVFSALGFDAALADVRCEDATTCALSPGSHDIVLTETMQRALTREPQVAIVRNLLAGIGPTASLVPETIELHAVLTSLGWECELLAAGRSPARARTWLGRVFELSSATALAEPPVTEFVIPRTPAHGEVLAITTRVRVFEDIELGEYESGLTHPMAVEDSPELREGQRLRVGYRLGPRPGPVCL